VISNPTAERNVRRFAALRGYPNPKGKQEAWLELVRTLAATSATDRHAESAVSQWLQVESECPTPAQLRALLTSATEPAWQPTRQHGRCELCGGSGRQAVFAVITRRDGRRSAIQYLAKPRSADALAAETARILATLGPSQELHHGDWSRPCGCGAAA
jgi:hypothetical protein